MPTTRLTNVVSDFCGVGFVHEWRGWGAPPWSGAPPAAPPPPAPAPRGGGGGGAAPPPPVSPGRLVGGVKTVTPPSFGFPPILWLKRLTRIRWPVCSVGTIDSDGIRYGLTANAWIVSAKNSATAIVTTSSTDWRTGFFFVFTGSRVVSPHRSRQMPMSPASG